MRCLVWLAAACLCGFGVLRLLAFAALVGSACPHEPERRLQIAAASGEAALVRHFLAEGASARWRDETGIDALACAATCGHADAAKALIEYGADVNGRDRLGYTPLLHACMGPLTDGSEAVELVDLLLAHGADPDARSNSGMTTIELATLRGDARIVRSLLAAKAARLLVFRAAGEAVATTR